MNEKTRDWPEYERRDYEWNKALGDLWLSLADHPLIRWNDPIRQHFEGLAIKSYGRAVEAEKEALYLIALLGRK